MEQPPSPLPHIKQNAMGVGFEMHPEDLAMKREGGYMLMVHLKKLLALGKLTSYDFSVACFYADMAGVLGDDFSEYAQHPDMQSGKYAAWLDGKFKLPDLLDYPEIPNRPTRSNPTKRRAGIKMSLAYESLWDEIQNDPQLLQQICPEKFPSAYSEHPIYKKSVAEGRPAPLPLALYTDGVRYLSMLNSNTDSLIGVWIVNVLSQKRHLVCSMRSNLMCACGCKGWCSMWCILKYLQWILLALARGIRPRARWNGDEAGAGHAIQKQIKAHGADLGFTAQVRQ